MNVGDLVSYLDRYCGIVVAIDEPNPHHASAATGVVVIWVDTGFRSWEFTNQLEVVSEYKKG